MIKIIQGDITTLAVDAIVNAANQVMLGGGGVDGAIHRTAGPELYEACLKVPEVRPGVRCPTGEARITPGFKLPAKYVIHTVGPVYRDGQHGEPEKLAACYRNSLALAAENGCKSIAFPCISTGVYGYPIEDAAKIAVLEVEEFLAAKNAKDAEVAESGQNGRARSPVSPERSEPRKRSLEVCAPQMEVIFCCFSERDKNVYEDLLSS
jgi:O-acetyl-ADP-ribose deacetylase (regulator of RNase III)